MAAKSRSEEPTHPRDFYYLAREYCDAAELVSKESTSGSGLPAYSLYFHAIEMAYKAFLLSRGYAPSTLKKLGHDLMKLHDACINEKIEPAPKLAPHLKKVSELMSVASVNESSRYQGSGHLKAVNLQWAKDVARCLLTLVDARLSYARLIEGGHPPNYVALMFHSAPGPEKFGLAPLAEALPAVAGNLD